MAKLGRKTTGLVATHADLVLLALVVEVTQDGEFGFGLVLEEGIMKHLIVNLYLAHLRGHTLTHLLLERLASIISLLSEFANTSLLDIIWQFEGDLVNTALILKISSLLAPVARYGNRVSSHLEIH